jgi:hypothetical protein
MSKRKRYIVAAFVASILVAIVAWIVVENLPPTPGITQTNFDRIEKGITKEEVEAILGEPAFSRVKTRTPGNVVHMWKSPSGSLATVAFSEDGKVIRKSWPADDESIFRKFRRWLFPNVRI